MRRVVPDEIGVFWTSRLRVVVRENGRVLVFRAVVLDHPVGERRVQTPSARLGDARVRDLARQRVLHRVLGLAGERRPATAANEVALLEQVEVRPFAFDQVDHRSFPERPTDDRRGLQRRLLDRGKPIHPGGDDGMDRIRNREPFRDVSDLPTAVPTFERARLDESTHELLEEKRGSLRFCDHERPQLVRRLPREQLAQHLARNLARQGLEPDRRRVPASAAPFGAPIEKLGPSGREQDDRRPGIAYDAVEKLEKIVFRPVDVLDEVDCRSFAGELLEEAHCGGMQALTRVERVEAARHVQSEGEAEDLVPGQARHRTLRSVAVENPEVLLQNLAERPVRDPVPIRETATCAPYRRRILTSEHLPQLAYQPCLSDAGLAHDRHQVGLLLRDDASIRRAEQVELGLAADEDATQAADTSRAHQRERPQHRAAQDFRRLPFCRHRPQLPELEGATGGRNGALSREHLARHSGLLESCTDVDRVPGDEGARLAGPTDDHLAGVHPDSERQPVAGQLLQAALHGDGGVQRSLSVILDRDRRPENRHHRVPREFLDRASGARDFLRHRVVEPVEQ